MDETKTGTALAGVAAALAASHSALPLPPLVVGKHRAMAAIPLADRIRRAGAEADIVALLAEGAAYPRASAKTRREWARAADARRLVLRPEPVAAPDVRA